MAWNIYDTKDYIKIYKLISFKMQKHEAKFTNVTEEKQNIRVEDDVEPLIAI